MKNSKNNALRLTLQTLKMKTRINVKEMCINAGVSYNLIQNMQRGVQNVPDEILKKFSNKYPEFMAIYMTNIALENTATPDHPTLDQGTLLNLILAKLDGIEKLQNEMIKDLLAILKKSN